jgi:hypothetical protein
VNLPLWLRWFLSALVAIVVLVVVVRFVNANNNDATASQSRSAAAQANEESTVVVEQDQAPHVAKLQAGVSPVTGIAGAVRRDINHNVNQGFINGPIQHTRCTALKPRGHVLRFGCAVLAANLQYPFLGVVDVSTGQITFCKKDPPPVPSENVPVSRRCTA